MKRILFFIIISLSFYCNGQSITLSPGNPSYPFTIKSGGATTGYYGDISTSAASGFQDFYVSGTSSSLGTNVGNIFGSNSRFGLNSATSLILRTTSADRMTILSNGNIGIGTGTPSSRFEISQATNDTDLRISADCGFCSTRLSFISDKATGGWRPAYIASGDNGSFTGRLDFFTNGTGGANQYGNTLGMSLVNKRVTIGSGFVTGTLGGSSTLELHPNSSDSFFPFRIFNHTNSKNWFFYVLSDSFNGDMQLYTNDGTRGVFNSASGVYSSLSDRNFKQNISSLNPIIDKVMALKATTYEFSGVNNSKKSIGFIAQEVEGVFPEFVFKSKDEHSGKEFYTMDYAGMSVIALKAIQEQQAMIKDLQAEILRLKK